MYICMHINKKYIISYLVNHNILTLAIKTWSEEMSHLLNKAYNQMTQSKICPCLNEKNKYLR